MRDLEIRGAGNLLGTQQSGHIAAVGYELYCQLLENAVRIAAEACRRRSAWKSISTCPAMPSCRRTMSPTAAEDRPLSPADARQPHTTSWPISARELVDRFGEPPRPVERLLDADRAEDGRGNLANLGDFHRETSSSSSATTTARGSSSSSASTRESCGWSMSKSVYLPLPQDLTDKDRIWRIVKSVLRPPQSATTIPARTSRTLECLVPCRRSYEAILVRHQLRLATVADLRGSRCAPPCGQQRLAGRHGAIRIRRRLSAATSAASPFESGRHHCHQPARHAAWADQSLRYPLPARPTPRRRFPSPQSASRGFPRGDPATGASSEHGISSSRRRSWPRSATSSSSTATWRRPSNMMLDPAMAKSEKPKSSAIANREVPRAADQADDPARWSTNEADVPGIRARHA